jgi:Pvc16 N-terminal domain
MSSALAIAAVTAVLQYYLADMYGSVTDTVISAVKVSCLAPDQVRQQIEGQTPDNENQVNLFLHQVTPNAAWRNVGLASMSADGTTRLNSPPLALDLHYLLTAYGSQYWQAEALLGYALLMLQEAPVLTRDDIVNAMLKVSPPPAPPALAPPSYFPGTQLSPYLQTSGLADQVEMIKITPESMTREELAWLWTALKADYRPTFPFKVSVVLIQPELPSTLALPVLQTAFAPVKSQPEAVLPMQSPQILTVEVPTGQVGSQPGQTVTVTGVGLGGMNRVMLTNARYGLEIPCALTQASGESVSFALPLETLVQYPAGVYDLTVQLMDSTGTIVQVASSMLPIAIAPTFTGPATGAASGTGTMVTINSPSFAPAVWEGQEVVLALSTFLSAPYISMSAQAQPFTGPPNAAPATSLSFLFDSGLPTGVKLLARLQIDGVTSAMTFNISTFPPSFVGPTVTL